MKTELETLHKELVGIIHKEGVKHPKKHGNWIILRLNDDWFLEMDSWNKAIHLRQGSGEPRNKDAKYYQDVCGFIGKSWIYYGLSFGRFQSSATIEQFTAMINRVNNWLAITQ
jgi:hypothetical protein